MAVPLHRFNQDRQQGLQTLAAHPVCGFPKRYQRISLDVLVNPRAIASPRCLAAVRIAAYQPHRMLPMVASNRDELVENATFSTRLDIRYRRANADFSSLRVAMLNRLIVAP